MSRPPASAQKLTLMLVDDERLARLHTRRIVETHADIDVVAETGDLVSARSLLIKYRPHILLLDIQLSPGSGFDLLPDLPPSTSLVFLTAYSKHAVRAFEANAVDYLLKPPTADRIAAALARARIAHSSPKTHQAIFIGTKSNWKRLPISEIVAIFADGVYSRIVARNGDSHLMQRSLNHWETLLAAANFVRIDRSLLINPISVQGFRSLGRDQSWLELDGFKEPVKLGRAGTYRARRLVENES